MRTTFSKHTAVYNPEIIDPWWNNVVYYGRYDSSITTDDAGLQTPTATGTVARDTATKKWGAASLYKPNGANFLTIGAANNTFFQFGTGDFTLECWMYVTAIGNSTTSSWNFALWSANMVAGTTSHIWALIYRTTRTPRFSIGHWDGTTFLENTQTSFDYNQWVHLTCCRAGTTIYLGVNGVVQNAGTCNKNLITTSTATRLCTSGYNEHNYTAYIDDFRVTKGVAKYISNYPVPSKALPTLTLA